MSNERIGLASFRLFLEKPVYKVCIVLIKVQDCEKRSTFCIHVNADCLLKNTSTKDNKIYPIELEIKDATDTARSVSYLDLHIGSDNESGKELNFTTKEMISIFPL
jgi:low affinity Fe/Cu permease